MTIETELPAVKAKDIEKPPFGAPMDVSGAPTCVMVDRLFALHRFASPPYRLRDELVVALEWAQFGYAVRDAADEITALRARCEKAEAELTDTQTANHAMTEDHAALKGRCAELVKALEPFSKFAAPVFDRNFNNDDPVDTITASDGEQVTLFARDYFAARAAITTKA